MRSVVVVLPASMCAMMPMLRTLLRSVVMSTATVLSQSLGSCEHSVTCVKPGPSGPGSQVTPTLWSLFLLSPAGRSPAVVGEGLVGLGHLVGVLATLHRGTEAVGGVEDLVHEPVGHGLLTSLGGVADQPAQREGGAPGALDLDRHLVGGATDAAGLDLDGRLDVVHGPLERDHGVGAGLVAAALEGGVDDALGDLLLAVLEHLGDELGDQLRPVDRVDVERPLGGGTLARHQPFSFFAP